MYWIGIDTGGTFTDVVVMDEEGGIIRAKAPTTMSDLSIGVLNGIKGAAESMGILAEDLLQKTALITHGCTTATNAFLTRSGAKTGLITTEGFEDIIFIMRARGRYAGLSEEQIKRVGRTEKPEPIVPKSLVKGVKERIDYKGSVIVPLDQQSAKQAIKNLVDGGVEAIAVSLLWSPANPTHEMEIKRIAKELYPDIYITLSSELIPVVGEYERTSTTVINAYCGPMIFRYLSTLEKKLKDTGFRYSPLIMQAYGGCLRTEAAVTKAVGTMSCGPVAGVIGSRFLAEILGYNNVITTDVGGTSFDVGLIYEGKEEIAVESVVGQYDLLIPMISIESIGAGGGSIARIEPVTNILKVGPQSAGAMPGPACYGMGGTEPTVTDADLILGYLNPDYFWGGKMKLNKERAIEVMKSKIADPWGVSVVETATAIYDIVNAHMSDLIRIVTIGRGYDPMKFVLFAYGGAGPLHAGAYGREAQAIIIPFTAATHSAMGTLASDVMHVHELGSPKPTPVDVEWFNKNFEDLEKKAIGEMRKDGFRDEEMDIKRTIHMRYARQVHEVATPIPLGKLNSEDLGRVYSEFERLYERLYGKGAGYREAGMEVVTFKVEGRCRVPKPKLRKYDVQSPDASGAVKIKRDVFLQKLGGFVNINIYDFDKLQSGNVIPGPAIIETPITTVLIDGDQTGRVDQYLNIIITKKKG
jgi:N-methylhydantoinase A